MKLQSARDLKEELIASLLAPASVSAPRAAAPRAPLVLGAARFAAAGRAGAAGTPLANVGQSHHRGSQVAEDRGTRCECG